MENKYNINIAILGPVSVGKSTLINSLFVDTYSDMKIKRTTMIPQIYHEKNNLEKDLNISNIRENNRLINENLIKKTENGIELEMCDIREIEYFVPKVHDLINLPENINLSIYDIPGLNDARTKNIYFEYIRQNFYKFDIILFVIDINSAMNTSDEIDILKLILEETKKNKINYDISNYLFVMINKCDTMYVDTDNKLTLEEEQLEMLDQVKKTVEQYISKINPDLKHFILPISLEDSYIYRMYNRNPDTKMDTKHLNKFGLYEIGKNNWNKLSEVGKKNAVKNYISTNYVSSLNLTGFNNFKIKLCKILEEENYLNFLQNQFKYQISLINNYKQLNVQDEISTMMKKYIEIYKISNISKIKLDISVYFKNKFQTYIINYLDNIVNISNDICIDELIIVKSCLDYLMNANDACDLILSKIIPVDSAITALINKYYVDKIKDTNLSISDMLHYFDQLYNYSYINLDQCIFFTISNNANIVACTAENLLKIRKKLLKKYHFSNKHDVTFLFSHLCHKYKKFYQDICSNNPRTNYIRVYNSYNYWQKVNITCNNEYSKFLIVLKMYNTKIYNKLIEIMPDDIVHLELPDEPIDSYLTDKYLIETILITNIESHDKVDNLLEI